MFGIDGGGAEYVRIAQLPDVPTVAEQGFPGFEMTQWHGLQAPEAMARLQADAAIPVGGTPAEFARFIADEQKRWKPVLQRAKVKPD